MNNLGITMSACKECRQMIPAKVITDGTGVFFQKFCPVHGESRVQIYGDINTYLTAQRFVKPAWEPDVFRGDSHAECPAGCGFCSRHEQHLCMPIIEITSRCNLSCPICINSSGTTRGMSDLTGDMTLEEFRGIVRQLIASERQIDLLNLSGGEPLLHPHLMGLLDEALSHPEIVRVSISTNGLAFLDHPRLLDAIQERKAVVSLQFDGFDDVAYLTLRGRKLVSEKQQILSLLKSNDTTTSLVMTLASGVNDRQISEIIPYLFAQRNIISLMIQPLAFAGRATRLKKQVARISIPEVVALLSASCSPLVKAEDFVPLPCSHPLCFSLAYYLMTDSGENLSINKLTDAATLMDALSNRTVFGLDPEEHAKMKSMIYDLWSGPAGMAPDSRALLNTLRGLLREMSDTSLCGCFDPRKLFTTAERRIKSIFIHAFQDADTFDLSRARRCCQAYPQPDGRLLPVCVRNVLMQGNSNKEDHEPAF